MRTTGPLLKVLTVFLENVEGEVYGLEILRATALKSGTLYPLLDRLETHGWVESRWEKRPLAKGSGPRRRFYKLTATGSHEARQTLLEHGLGRVVWGSV